MANRVIIIAGQSNPNGAARSQVASSTATTAVRDRFYEDDGEVYGDIFEFIEQ